MNRFTRIALTAVVALILASGVASAQTSLRVGASPVPHSEILELIQPILAAQGIDLEIVVFTDYVLPNLALAEGELDANYFQHVPYLEQFSADHGLDLTVVGGVHVEPIGLYSQNLTTLEGLPQGTQVAIPNDPSNSGRALLLLEAAGLIGLADDAGLSATSLDITDNPHGLRFIELEAAQLPRSLADVGLAVINTNYALEAGLNPVQDALALEGAESPYVNVVVVQTGREHEEVVAALIDALQSEHVREFIISTYEGAVVATF